MKITRKNDSEESIVTEAILMTAGFVALIIILIFIGPWISFWLAYFSGWIAKITVGKYLVSGFGLLGLDIPLEKIPLLAGVLGFIGSFFKSTNYKIPNKKTSD